MCRCTWSCTCPGGVANDATEEWTTAEAAWGSIIRLLPLPAEGEFCTEPELAEACASVRAQAEGEGTVTDAAIATGGRTMCIICSTDARAAVACTRGEILGPVALAELGRFPQGAPTEEDRSGDASRESRAVCIAGMAATRCIPAIWVTKFALGGGVTSLKVGSTLELRIAGGAALRLPVLVGMDSVRPGTAGLKTCSALESTRGIAACCARARAAGWLNGRAGTACCTDPATGCCIIGTATAG